MTYGSVRRFTFAVSAVALAVTSAWLAPTSHAAASSPGWHASYSVKRIFDRGGFYGVAARTASDAWAVGGTSQYPGHEHAIVAHWNGKTWSLRTLPLAGSFSSVASGGPDDAMAVGKVKTSTGGDSGLAARWNGHRWIDQHWLSFAEYRAHYLRYQGGHWAAVIGSHQPAPVNFMQNPQMWLARVPGTGQLLSVGFAVTRQVGQSAAAARFFTLRESWQ